MWFAIDSIRAMHTVTSHVSEIHALYGTCVYVCGLRILDRRGAPDVNPQWRDVSVARELRMPRAARRATMSTSAGWYASVFVCMNV